MFQYYILKPDIFYDIQSIFTAFKFRDSPNQKSSDQLGRSLPTIIAYTPSSTISGDKFKSMQEVARTWLVKAGIDYDAEEIGGVKCGSIFSKTKTKSRDPWTYSE
jgi:hypothetical protein